jgi:hypothetical protein
VRGACAPAGRVELFRGLSLTFAVSASLIQLYFPAFLFYEIVVREHMQQPLCVDLHAQRTLNGVNIKSSITENKSRLRARARAQPDSPCNVGITCEI